MTTEIRYIDRVSTASGKEILIADLPCDLCGTVNAPYIAITGLGVDDWAFFCSPECRHEAITVNGEKLTPEIMERAGITFIGPRPEA